MGAPESLQVKSKVKIINDPGNNAVISSNLPQSKVIPRGIDRDLANLRHQGNINEDVIMKNNYTFPKLENFENK